ncbi:MAG: DUF599 domain-containing protein [Burkholderiales bacterium]|nr:DUF599 domain-containing protein [Burkholderiales bacterium]
MSFVWRGFHFEAIDVIALGWFFIFWIAYAEFAGRRSKRVPSLMSVMGEYRREWWARIIERDMRIVDTSIVANLANSATFFASTTLLILGGLLALLGTTEKVVAVVQGLPFNARTSTELWEIKILLLLGIFVYAFFKFTWSLRQFNFTSVLIGAAPKVPDHSEREALFIARAAQLATSASESFNYGLRAYYFGLAALTWFVNSWLFMAATAWTVGVLYWREFRSETLNLLKRS